MPLLPLQYLPPIQSFFHFLRLLFSPDHGPDCLGHTVVILKAYVDIIPYSRDLVSHLNVSFYHADEHALLISHQNIMQLLSPWYNASQISQSAISQNNFGMRSIFLKQNANDYCHLHSFLQRIHTLNPQLTVALKVDYHNGVFYKMPLYNGVLIFLVAKSGNGSLLFLVAAWQMLHRGILRISTEWDRGLW
jgi:hypothetical protein